MAFTSLSNGVSGMQTNQQGMNVISNNISNVNTAGFKSSQANFSDMFYDDVSGATPEVNPVQVGYGSQVADVTKNMASTTATSTGNPQNVYIDGNGYIAVCTTPGKTTADYYTRVGNLHFDPKDGSLVDSNGNYVLGINNTESNYTYGVEGNIKIVGATFVPDDGSTPSAVNATNYGTIDSMSFKPDGTISATLGGKNGTFKDANGVPLRLGIAQFANPGGLQAEGSNYYSTTQSSGNATYVGAKTDNSIKVETGMLEASNVDLAKEFSNMIVTERGYQACSRVITVSDSMMEELINLKRS